MSTVETERVGHTLLIRMQREAKRNAIDHEMTRELDAAFNELDDDPDLWVGVLTGTPRVFCAGSDLSTTEALVTERGGEYGLVRRRRSTPLIAAVEGIAYGGGFEVVLACDLVVAAEDARFGLPEVRRGVIATSGALLRAPRAMPAAIAREMLLVGEPMTAARMYELGVVNRVVAPGAVLEEALALATSLCEASPTSVRATLHALDAQLVDGDAAGWAATAASLHEVAASKDLQEGIAAFFEKRPPRWTNS